MFPVVFFRSSLFCVALLLLSILPQLTKASAQGVDDFVLLDQHGKAQQMHYHKDAPAIVLIVHGNGCQIIRSLLPDYRALRDDYADHGVPVWMINSNLQDDRTSIVNEAEQWGLDFSILDDATQDIGRSLKLTRTGEVLVIDPKTWQIVYRGALNDRVHFERQKKEASNRYVREVLDQLIAGDTPAFAENNGPGCVINFAQRSGSDISYSETIAPLLIDKCTACHVQGGIAPWAMSEYRMIQGFAPMIREVLRTKRMPPWHVDPEVGEWQHDAGLSDEQTAILMAWLEAGAPRGNGEDPLKNIPPLNNKWTLGEPDLIIEVPAFKVPATGIVEYQYPQIPNPLGRDAWVIAATVIPGDPKAVHHVLMGANTELPDPGESQTSEVFDNYIMGYAPGNESAHMPEGTGVFVPKDAFYSLQMHYTPYGREATDVTRVGLYFADEPPRQFLRQEVIVNTRLEIPAHAAAHEEAASFRFYHDAVIYALTPHSHYRGKSSVFKLLYPDGQEELILSVPNYDFNWQRTYSFEQPKRVPAGTRMIHRTVYDNSSNNPGNPDPEQVVTWGLQSAQEMLYGSVSYAWADELAIAPIHDDLRSDAAQFLGVIDQDFDGKASKQELPARMVERIGKKWRFVDTNGDGGLDHSEVEKLFSRMQ
ncbi:MAG: redoxin domain-containing protein [Pseudomonadota bacterium]